MLQVNALKAGSKEMKKQFKAMDIGDIDVCQCPFQRCSMNPHSD
jgi:hypothetical protein